MSFNPKSVAIVAITYFPKWYKGILRSIKHTDKVRGDLVLEFAKKAAKLKYQLILVDGGSSKTFKKEISNINGVLVIKRRNKKRSPGKRIGIRFASKLHDVKVIVITEAEKVSLIANCILQITKPILEGIAEVVVAKREYSLFKSTYPEYMFESEAEGNKLYNEVLIENKLLSSNSEGLDMFFGPRAFRNDPKIVSMFMKKYHIFSSEYFDSEEWSNTLFFPIVLALLKRFRVKSVTVPFSYPEKQKKNEEASSRDVFIEKRRAQRMGLLIELLHFMSYIKKEKIR
jgi:hypothetical protein